MPKSRRSKACDIRKDVKQTVWDRDDHCCILCGKPVAMQYANAHYIPRSQGGLGIEQNVVTMCFDCHFRQHNTDEGDKIFRFIGQHLHKWLPRLGRKHPKVQQGGAMKLLCRPCAEELKKQGVKLVRKSIGIDAKIICEKCGRRRYGSAWEEKRNVPV